MVANSVVTLRRNFTRPDEATLQKFAGIPTGFVTDALGRRGAIAAEIRPVAKFKPFVGTALTVNDTAASNLALGVAMGEMRPGDVLMIAAESFTGAAVFGGNIAGMCKNGDITAMVVDGAVRDAQEIGRLELPVYARAVTPNSPFKHGPGSVGLDVVIGGVNVSSGDIIVGDEDGVVVVPQKKIADVIEALERVKAKEKKQGVAIAGGLVVPEWLSEFREKGGVQLVD